MGHGVFSVEEVDVPLHPPYNLNQIYLNQICVWSSVSQQVLYESFGEIFFLFPRYY